MGSYLLYHTSNLILFSVSTIAAMAELIKRVDRNPEAIIENCILSWDLNL